MYQRKLPKEYYCTVDYGLDIFGASGSHGFSVSWGMLIQCVTVN